MDKKYATFTGSHSHSTFKTLHTRYRYTIRTSSTSRTWASRTGEHAGAVSYLLRINKILSDVTQTLEISYCTHDSTQYRRTSREKGDPVGTYVARARGTVASRTSQLSCQYACCTCRRSVKDLIQIDASLHTSVFTSFTYCHVSTPYSQRDPGAADRIRRDTHERRYAIKAHRTPRDFH